MTEMIVYQPQPSEIATAIGIIKTAHPQSASIPDHVLQAAALLGLQVGANINPIVQELHIGEIAGKWIPMLGIAYYRRIAEERGARVMFLPRDSETRLTNEPREMTPAEREMFGVHDGIDAAICRGYRGDRLIELLDHGVPWRDAIELLARVGVGYLRDAEKKKRDGAYKNPPTGRSWQWVADKRAEKDLYMKLGVVAQVVNVVEQQAIATAQAIEAGPRYTLEQANADLF